MNRELAATGSAVGRVRVGSVLQVITDTDRRGAQIFADDLEQALLRRGHRVRTVALVPGAGGDVLGHLPTLGTARLGLATLRRLRSAARDAAAIVAHGSTTLPACMLAAAGTGIPIVYRNISDPVFWLDRPNRRVRSRVMLNQVAAVVCLWEGGADFLRDEVGVAPERIAVIPNGVPSERFPVVQPRERPGARASWGLDPDAPTLLFIAALKAEKHPGTAVRALADLPGYQLLIAGNGELRSELEALAERVAPGRVRFAGQIADPMRAYRAADIVVLPSQGEGLPAVLIEAGLVGLPAVASPSGGNTDIVVDGETGIIVPHADPAALAAGVRTVMEDPEPYGRAARAHCEGRFDIATVAAQWESLLARVGGSA